MHDVMRMAVLQRAHDLLEEAPRLVLWHLAAPDDVIEQLAREVFDDHDDVGRSGDDIVAVYASLSALSGRSGELRTGRTV